MKKIFATLAMALLLAGPATAQVFLDDDDMNRRGGNGDGNMDIGNIIPEHNVDWDQANYTPLGEGIMLLSVLGGAYLLGKRRKDGER